MALLKFTLSEEGVSALRDALTCLNKFSEEVSFEAQKDALVFTALNSSKSAYASFSFAASRFFSRYQYEGVNRNRDKFFCKLYNRALLSLFRARSGDPLHEHDKDTTIERCDVAVEDDPGKKSRFVVRMIFRNGMKTTCRLPFEVSPPVHAKFNKDEATSNWSISSRTLRQLMDHFGPGTEFLDIHSDDDQTVNLTCFTEKVANGDELLKKPLHTSIAVERDEFEHFEVNEEKLHIVISVKDFRAVTQHASSLSSDVQALYSLPSRPMQLKYEGDGLSCEFLLMTVGERGAPGQKTKAARNIAKPSKTQQLEAAASRATSHAPTAASQPIRVRNDPPVPSLRPSITQQSQRPPPPTFEDDSLFVPMDNDSQWEPVTLNEVEDEEESARLEWMASAQPNPSALNMRSVMAQQAIRNDSTFEEPNPTQVMSNLEPTQRLSDVRKFGLFGE